MWGGLFSRQPPSPALVFNTEKPAEAGFRLNRSPHTKAGLVFSKIGINFFPGLAFNKLEAVENA
jgi:hypothetical protein